jgi:hypothetical protein
MSKIKPDHGISSVEIRLSMKTRRKDAKTESSHQTGLNIGIYSCMGCKYLKEKRIACRILVATSRQMRSLGRLRSKCAPILNF